MAQLNINMTSEFKEALAKFMRLRRIKTKSEAIRLAVHEGLELLDRRMNNADFTSWLGMAREAPENPTPRFATHDELWR